MKSWLFCLVLICIGCLSFLVPETDTDIYYIDEPPKDDRSIQTSVSHYQVFYDNQDIIGTIEVSGTSIHYPVVQTDDNTFYLNHDIRKNEDKNGSIFLDYRNKLTDQQLNFYGHTNSDGSGILAELKKLLEPSFLKENNLITVTLLDGSTRYYEIFSVSVTKSMEHMNLLFQEKGDWMKHLAILKANSNYDTGISITKEDSILTIQTCSYEAKNTYLVISAKERSVNS